MNLADAQAVRYGAAYVTTHPLYQHIPEMTEALKEAQDLMRAITGHLHDHHHCAYLEVKSAIERIQPLIQAAEAHSLPKVEPQAQISPDTAYLAEKIERLQIKYSEAMHEVAAWKNKEHTILIVDLLREDESFTEYYSVYTDTPQGLENAMGYIQLIGENLNDFNKPASAIIWRLRAKGNDPGYGLAEEVHRHEF